MFYHSITKFVFIFKSLSGSLEKSSAVVHTRTCLQLPMSRPLFAGTHVYLRSCGGLSANQKEEKMHRMIIKLFDVPSFPGAKML